VFPLHAGPSALGSITCSASGRSDNSSVRGSGAKASPFSPLSVGITPAAYVSDPILSRLEALERLICANANEHLHRLHEIRQEQISRLVAENASDDDDDGDDENGD